VSWREKIWSSFNNRRRSKWLMSNKVQTEKEIRKHGHATDFYTRNHLRSIELRQISLLESPHGIRFENVYVYSKSLQQLKYWRIYLRLKKLILHSPIITMYYHRTRRFQIPFLYSMMWHATSKTRSENTLRWVDTRMSTAFICIRHTQRCRMQICWFCSNGTIWNMYIMIM